MDDDDWPYFPVILGQGSLHDLSDRDEPEPRLFGMRSVSRAAAIALHRHEKPKVRQAGFAHHLVKGTKPPHN